MRAGSTERQGHEGGGGPPPPPSWWSRNWKWVVPVGCLGMILFPVACAGLIYLAIYGAIQGTEPYHEALARARYHPEAVAALGEPIEAGFFVSGSIHFRGSGGDADFSVSVSGPEDEGTIYVVAEKVAGRWEYSRMVLEVESSGRRIDLLQSPQRRLTGTRGH